MAGKSIGWIFIKPCDWIAFEKFHSQKYIFDDLLFHYVLETGPWCAIFRLSAFKIKFYLKTYKRTVCIFGIHANQQRKKHIFFVLVCRFCKIECRAKYFRLQIISKIDTIKSHAYA